MRELMSVNMTLLRKMKSLWFTLSIVTVLISILTYVASKDAKNPGFIFLFELIGWIPEYAFVAACFVSLFLGREYSRGTIRNKIIAGYSRFEIYISFFLTGWIIFSVWFGAMFLTGFCGLLIAGTYPVFVLQDFLWLTGFCLLAGAIETALILIIFFASNSCSNCILACIISFVIFIFLSYIPMFNVGSVVSEVSKDESGNMIVTDGSSALEKGSIERRITEDLFLTLPIVQFEGLSDRWGYELLFVHLNCENRILIIDFLWLVVLATVGIWIFEHKKVR